MNSKIGFVSKSVRWISERIISTDYFGVPISLNYMGRSTYKTLLGGFITISIGKYSFVSVSLIYKKKLYLIFPTFTVALLL